MTPRVSGALLFDQRALMERVYGRQVLDAALARLTEDQQAELRAATPVSWMLVTTVTALKTEVAHEIGMDPLELQREIVRQSIGDTIKKFWRLLLRQLWDGAIVKRTPIIYKKAFDSGEMTLDTIEEGRATFVLTGWPDIPDFDCVGLTTGMAAMLEYSGRKGARVQYRREPTSVVFEAEWTPRKRLFA